MYATVDDYASFGSGTIPEELIEKYLDKASRQVDTLTYNRIVAIGVSELTVYQHSEVTYVTCMLADFLYENEDELESLLQSYGINGVSMTFATGNNVVNVNGIIVRTDIYSELKKTGLCNPVIR